MSRATQHSRLCPGWKTLPTRIGYSSNTNCGRRFRSIKQDSLALLTRNERWHHLGHQGVNAHTDCGGVAINSSKQTLHLAVAAVAALSIMPNQHQTHSYNGGHLCSFNPNVSKLIWDLLLPTVMCTILATQPHFTMSIISFELPQMIASVFSSTRHDHTSQNGKQNGVSFGKGI